MRLLPNPAAAFDALTPYMKAVVIMAVCGVVGVLSGFVLYIVFTHLLEQGGVAAKLTGAANAAASAKSTAEIFRYVMSHPHTEARSYNSVKVCLHSANAYLTSSLAQANGLPNRSPRRRT